MIGTKERSDALARAYAEWLATLAPVTPDADWATADPSQYTENAEVVSCSDEDQMRLFEMQREALADLEASLIASAAMGWRDQLRIPAGNGHRSGRWTYTPWAWLDNLMKTIGSQPEIGVAQSRLKDLDRNNFDVRDQNLAEAVKQAAKDLDGVPGAEETQQALKDWADTDWTLFAEETDIGSNDEVPIVRGKGLWQWKEPLPPETPVNPAYNDWTSARLVARLDEIANHHTAPSPKMRRDRTEIMQELNDRKAGAAPQPPKPAPVIPPPPTPGPTPDVPPVAPSIVRLRHPDAKQPSTATRNPDGSVTVVTPDGKTHTPKGRKGMTHVLVRRNGGPGNGREYVPPDSGEYFVSLAGSEEKALREGNVQARHRTHIEVVPIVDAPVAPEPTIPSPAATDAPVITGLSHEYGSATAKVTPFRTIDRLGRTVEVEFYNQWDDEESTSTAPSAHGRVVKKDGTTSARLTELHIPVPENIKRALAEALKHRNQKTPFEEFNTPIEDQPTKPGDPTTADIVNAYAWGGLGIQNGMEVNGNLRKKGYEGLDEAHRNFVDGLDKAIAEADSSQRLTVSRTVADPMVASEVDALKPGDIFEDAGYMSTTTDDDILNDFVVDDGARVDFVIDLMPGDPRLSVDDYTPDDAFKQNEYLLPRGTRLYINSVEQGPDGTVVYARIAPKESDLPKPTKKKYEAPPEIPRLSLAENEKRERAINSDQWRPTLQESAHHTDPRFFYGETDSAKSPEQQALMDFFRANVNGLQDRSINLAMYQAIDLAKKADMPEIVKLLEVANWGIENGDRGITKDAFEQILWAGRTTPLIESRGDANFIGGFGSIATARAHEAALARFEKLAVDEMRHVNTQAELHDLLKFLKANAPSDGRNSRYGGSLMDQYLDTAITASEPDASPAAAIRRATIVFNGPEWREAVDAVADKIMPDYETPLYEKFGTIPEDRRHPQAVIADIGKFYSIRTLGSNCVLASQAYELRRRGIDAEPKQAKHGRNAESAQSLWYRNPVFITVKGLKGLHKQNRSRVVYQHVRDNYPRGSRGTIRCGWKGRSFGHIWNWEVHDDGEVVFYDAQTGKIVPPDSSYWFDMEWNGVTTVRLDNLRLLEDIEVLISRHAVELSAADRALVERYQELRDRMRAMLERDPYAYQRSVEYKQMFDEAEEIRKRLKKIADSYEILDPSVNTLAKLNGGSS
jgi:hypothetical protein